MEKVTAYKSSDGKLFEDLEVLEMYEEKLKKKVRDKELYSFIKTYIQKGYYRESDIKKSLIENKELLIEILNKF